MRQLFEAAVSWSYDSPAKGGLHHAHYPGRVANRMDSERCEQVSSVKDLYGTTHSVSYKFDPWQEAWAKFKLDGKYDTFEANIVTSDDTNRDANMSIEIYVDDVLVGRVDDIVRDENVRPISVSVNGGKVLMIKAVNTNSAGNSYCYVSDTNLALLQ